MTSTPHRPAREARPSAPRGAWPEELAPASDQITEPAAPQARTLLDQYIAAFENADASALERLLVHDATLEATPLRTWFTGRKTCAPFLRDYILGSPYSMLTGVPGTTGRSMWSRIFSRTSACLSVNSHLTSSCLAG
ncbi:MAG TPA: hypothetical protein VHZ03_38550 [Trebonia sp.]|nr:hypothetical protein [Trebonia sp.]